MQAVRDFHQLHWLDLPWLEFELKVNFVILVMNGALMLVVSIIHAVRHESKETWMPVGSPITAQY